MEPTRSESKFPVPPRGRAGQKNQRPGPRTGRVILQGLILLFPALLGAAPGGNGKANAAQNGGIGEYKPGEPIKVESVTKAHQRLNELYPKVLEYVAKEDKKINMTQVDKIGVQLLDGNEFSGTLFLDMNIKVLREWGRRDRNLIEQSALIHFSGGKIDRLTFIKKTTEVRTSRKTVITYITNEKVQSNVLNEIFIREEVREEESAHQGDKFSLEDIIKTGDTYAVNEFIKKYYDLVAALGFRMLKMGIRRGVNKVSNVRRLLDQ